MVAIATPAGRAARSGAAYDPAALALFARFTTPPSTGRKGLINACIVAMKRAGIWTKLDAFYMLAAETSQAARQNWVQDAYNLTAVNGPTFTADRGYAGDGSSSYLNTGFNPATATSPVFSLNSAHVTLTDRTSGAADSTIPFGGLGGSSNVLMALDLSSKSGAYADLSNANSLGVVGTNSNRQGRFSASRTSSTAVSMYKNGSGIVSGSSTSTTVPSVVLFICGCNISGLFGASSDQFAQSSIGGALTSTDAANFDVVISTYLTAVGA